MTADGAPTFLSLFAGVGGFDLGLKRAGFRCVGQVEIDPFCTRVLAARFPGVPRWGDVRSLQSDSLWQLGLGWKAEIILETRSGSGRTPRLAGIKGAVDLLVAGFPCQDFSSTGKRAGLEGYRGTLFWEIVRIAKLLKPPQGLFENVPGLLSSRAGRDFWAVLEGLRECWPVVGWRVLDSQHFGVPQRRRRVFLVCGPTDAAVAEVLALAEGGGGSPPAGVEAGAEIARAPAICTGIVGRYGKGTDSDATDGFVVNALRAGGGLRGDGGDNLVVAATLNSGGNDGGFRTEPGAHLIVETAPTAGLVRRLTPLKCERLQSFPDGWTCLCQPLAAYADDPEEAGLRCRCPDLPRYRACGNAVTVNVAEWIGRRLAREAPH